MMLPFIDAEENEIQEEQYIPKEYGINFETGQLSGKIVEGFDAILVWAWLALQTPRYRNYKYSENYGQEYEDLIGKSYSTELTDSELEALVLECNLIKEHRP